MEKILMTRFSVCSLGVSFNEMIDTPMLLVVVCAYKLLFVNYFLDYMIYRIYKKKYIYGDIKSVVLCFCILCRVLI